MSEQQPINLEDLLQAPPKKKGIGRRILDKLFSPWMQDIETTPYDLSLIHI